MKARTRTHRSTHTYTHTQKHRPRSSSTNNVSSVRRDEASRCCLRKQEMAAYSQPPCRPRSPHLTSASLRPHRLPRASGSRRCWRRCAYRSTRTDPDIRLQNRNKRLVFNLLFLHITGDMCLSRACLGKHSDFSLENGAKTFPRTRERQHRVILGVASRWAGPACLGVAARSDAEAEAERPQRQQELPIGGLIVHLQISDNAHLPSTSSVSHLCPEPVLVNRSFLCKFYPLGGKNR